MPIRIDWRIHSWAPFDHVCGCVKDPFHSFSGWDALVVARHHKPAISWKDSSFKKFTCQYVIDAFIPERPLITFVVVWRTYFIHFPGEMLLLRTMWCALVAWAVLVMDGSHSRVKLFVGVLEKALFSPLADRSSNRPLPVATKRRHVQCYNLTFNNPILPVIKF